MPKGMNRLVGWFVIEPGQQYLPLKQFFIFMIKQFKAPDFLIIPYQLLNDPDISLADERIYGIIYWLTKLKNEQCTASNRYLSIAAKVAVGTVQNSLTKLEQKGFILRRFSDNARKKRQEIIPLVSFRVSPTNDTVSPTNDTGYHPQVNRRSKSTKEEKQKYILATQSVAGLNEIIDLFKTLNPSYKKLFANKTQRMALERLIKQHSYEKVERMIEFTAKVKNQPYAPTITTPLQLEDKLGSLIAFYQKNKNKTPLVISI